MSNLMWVCELCHTLLNEFCLKYCKKQAEKKRMDAIRKLSVEVQFSQWTGKINKRESSEQWNIGNLAVTEKKGKEMTPPRTADRVWADLQAVRKHMRIDVLNCIDYLQQYVKYTKESVGPTVAFWEKGRIQVGEPILLVAPSLADFRAEAKKVTSRYRVNMERKKMTKKSVEKALNARKKDKAREDEFFNTIFKPLRQVFQIGGN